MVDPINADTSFQRPLESFRLGIFEPQDLSDNAPMRLYHLCAKYIVTNINLIPFSRKLPSEVCDNLIEVFRKHGSKSMCSRFLSEINSNRCRVQDVNFSDLELKNKDLLDFVESHAKTIRMFSILNCNRLQSSDILSKTIDTLIQVKDPFKLHRVVTCYEIDDEGPECNALHLKYSGFQFAWRKTYHNKELTTVIPKETRLFLPDSLSDDLDRHDAFNVTHHYFSKPLLTDYELHQAMGLFDEIGFCDLYAHSTPGPTCPFVSDDGGDCNYSQFLFINSKDYSDRFDEHGMISRRNAFLHHRIPCKSLDGADDLGEEDLEELEEDAPLAASGNNGGLPSAANSIAATGVSGSSGIGVIGSNRPSHMASSLKSLPWFQYGCNSNRNNTAQMVPPKKRLSNSSDNKPYGRINRSSSSAAHTSGGGWSGQAKINNTASSSSSAALPGQRLPIEDVRMEENADYDVQVASSSQDESNPDQFDEGDGEIRQNDSSRQQTERVNCQYGPNFSMQAASSSSTSSPFSASSTSSASSGASQEASSTQQSSMQEIIPHHATTSNSSNMSSNLLSSSGSSGGAATSSSCPSLDSSAFFATASVDSSSSSSSSNMSSATNALQSQPGSSGQSNAYANPPQNAMRANSQATFNTYRNLATLQQQHHHQRHHHHAHHHQQHSLNASQQSMQQHIPPPPYAACPSTRSSITSESQNNNNCMFHMSARSTCQHNWPTTSSSSSPPSPSSLFPHGAHHEFCTTLNAARVPIFGTNLRSKFSPYEVYPFRIENGRTKIIEIRTWEETPLETLMISKSAMPEDKTPGSCNASYQIAETLFHPQLTNLKRLTVHDWPVDVTSFIKLDLNPALGERLLHLDLSNCASIGDGRRLLQLSQLRTLILFNCPKVFKSLDNICKLKSLRVLDISTSNETTSSISHQFQEPVQELTKIIENLPNLTSLDISGTNLAGLRSDTIIGLESRQNNPLDFLGIFHTSIEAALRENIPAVRVAGDAGENMILTACEAYMDRVEMLRKGLNELFQLFRYESRQHDLERALKILVAALGRHPQDKLVQVASSATLFYIVKSDEAKLLLGRRVKELIVTRLLDAMQAFRYDPTMLRNGCLNLIHFRIPADVISEYTRLADILLYIVTNDDDDFVQRLGIYLLNSLACQVDGEQKTIVGNLGAIEKMLQLIEIRFNRSLCDEVMETAWSTMWNVTDETPINCERFLNNNGMEFFVSCMDKFSDYPELLRNMMGLLGNVSECAHLRYRLMKQDYISRFIILLASQSDGIEVSYNSAGILAHIASDGPTIWNRHLEKEKCSRDDMLRNMEAAISRWEINSKRNINYRSFEPILRLLRVLSISWQAQYWAVWALANLTRVHCSKYCALLEKDGGVEVLKYFVTAQRPDNFQLPTSVKCLAVVTLFQYYLYQHCGNLTGLDKSAEIACFYAFPSYMVRNFFQHYEIEHLASEFDLDLAITESFSSSSIESDRNHRSNQDEIFNDYDYEVVDTIMFDDGNQNGAAAAGDNAAADVVDGVNGAGAAANAAANNDEDMLL